MITEATLVSELKDPATREAAFSTLIATYKERLYWHIRKMVYVHDDADDVLQNTFIKVYRSIDSFKEESKLYTWMYRIATNEAISFINKKARQMEVSNQEVRQLAVTQLTADVYFDGNQIQLKLQEAIARLPQKQQLVFNMKYFDNLKYDEISDILDTSVGALKASYFHAVKKIKKFIEMH